MSDYLTAVLALAQRRREAQQERAANLNKDLSSGVNVGGYFLNRFFDMKGRQGRAKNVEGMMHTLDGPVVADGSKVEPGIESTITPEFQKLADKEKTWGNAEDRTRELNERGGRQVEYDAKQVSEGQAKRREMAEAMVGGTNYWGGGGIDNDQVNKWDDTRSGDQARLLAAAMRGQKGAGDQEKVDDQLINALLGLHSGATNNSDLVRLIGESGMQALWPRLEAILRKRGQGKAANSLQTRLAQIVSGNPPAPVK